MNDIITQAKKGNRHAMDELYKCTVNELRYYCSQLCGNSQDTEDLIQETYMTAFSKLEQYRRDENFKGWLHTIALHKFCNRIRDEKPQLRSDENIEYLAEDELCGPESLAENNEIRKMLDKIISGNLSESQRLTVMMYYYDDMNIPVIAKKLECPEGTVKTRLYHSRKIIREELLKRGITLGGGVIIISAILKSHRFTVSAVSASGILFDNAVKSQKAVSGTVKVIASKKLIAGVSAIVIASGGAVGIYHMTSKSYNSVFSDISIEYKFDADKMRISIPDNYTTELFFRSGNDENGYSLVKIGEKLFTIREKTFISLHNKEFLIFSPDDSGDEIVLRERTELPDDIDIRSLISELYENVSVSDSEQFTIKADNTNSPQSPTEKTAERFSFKAYGEHGKIKGTAVMFRGNLGKTNIILFCNCSGKRQKEYENIIDSISLSYIDNSWRDKYDIPEEFQIKTQNN